MVTDMIESMIEGRIRLRSKHFTNPDMARQFAEIAVAIPGMLEVAVNPLTGGVLLRYDPAQLSSEELLVHGETLAAMLPPEALQARPEKKKAENSYLRMLRGKKSRHFVNKGMALSFVGTLATGYVRRRWHPGLGWLLAGLTVVHYFQTRK